MRPAWIGAARQERERAVENGHVRVGRDDVDMIALDQYAVADLSDRHRGGAAQRLRQQAVVLRIEMLDENERHAGIGRQTGQELREGFQPSRRGSNTDDWKRRLLALRLLACRRRVCCRWLGARAAVCSKRAAASSMTLSGSLLPRYSVGVTRRQVAWLPCGLECVSTSWRFLLWSRCALSVVLSIDTGRAMTNNRLARLKIPQRRASVRRLCEPGLAIFANHRRGIRLDAVVP